MSRPNSFQTFLKTLAADSRFVGHGLLAIFGCRDLAANDGSHGELA